MARPPPGGSGATAVSFKSLTTPKRVLQQVAVQGAERATAIATAAADLSNASACRPTFEFQTHEEVQAVATRSAASFIGSAPSATRAAMRAGGRFHATGAPGQAAHAVHQGKGAHFDVQGVTVVVILARTGLFHQPLLVLKRLMAEGKARQRNVVAQVSETFWRTASSKLASPPTWASMKMASAIRALGLRRGGPQPHHLAEFWLPAGTTAGC